MFNKFNIEKNTEGIIGLRFLCKSNLKRINWRRGTLLIDNPDIDKTYQLLGGISLLDSRRIDRPS